MLTVAVPKRNKLPNIIVLTPKDGEEVKYPLTKERFFYYNRKSKKHKQKMMTETVRCFKKA